MPTYVARLEVLVEADSYDEAVKLAETCAGRLNMDIAWRWNDGTIRNAAMTHLSVQYKPLEWPADVNEGSNFDWERAQRVVLPKLRRSDLDDG